MSASAQRVLARRAVARLRRMLFFGFVPGALLVLWSCNRTERADRGRGGRGPDTIGVFGTLSRGEDWEVTGLGLRFVWSPSMGMWIGRCEVTNAQFRAYRPLHNSGDYNGISLDRDVQPVVEVSFWDANAYAEWVTARELGSGRLPRNYEIRLPSVAEWERFAYCGRWSRFPWGDEWPPPQTWNYHGQESGDSKYHQIKGHDDGYPVSAPVAACDANAWGLLGVADNVAEWSRDLFNADGWRQVCGGSWAVGSDAELERIAFGYPPDALLPYVGFRLVIAPSGKTRTGRQRPPASGI